MEKWDRILSAKNILVNVRWPDFEYIIAFEQFNIIEYQLPQALAIPITSVMADYLFNSIYE